MKEGVHVDWGSIGDGEYCKGCIERLTFTLNRKPVCGTTKKPVAAAKYTCGVKVVDGINGLCGQLVREGDADCGCHEED